MNFRWSLSHNHLLLSKDAPRCCIRDAQTNESIQVQRTAANLAVSCSLPLAKTEGQYAHTCVMKQWSGNLMPVGEIQTTAKYLLTRLDTHLLSLLD